MGSAQSGALPAVGPGLGIQLPCSKVLLPRHALSLAALLQGRDGMHPLFSISAPLMVDKEVETPEHFVVKHIEPNYHWNEWDLRKKALQMANIRRKVTVST